jgi:predicted GNAT superfamily acetyltransferase
MAIPRLSVPERPAFDIRPIATLAEYHACAALQADVWGAEFDVVPPSVLQVATYVGGLCIGAFQPDGELCGLVFGLSGTQDGAPMHWSHLLAVRPSVRSLGVGRLLKERQRELLASRGIPEMRWSFDPLIVTNAHFNLNRLGARIVRFVPDMYGTTGSPLHHGLATDRLVAALKTTPMARTAPPAATAGRAAVLTPAPRPGDELQRLDADPAAQLWLEIPSDFPRLLVQSPTEATAWHGAVRRHFMWALHAGYTVTGLLQHATSERVFYTLSLH